MSVVGLLGRAAKTAEDARDLQFLMNTGAEAIAKGDRMGGFPMPSLAVTRQDLPFENFGPITLLGDPARFDPKALKSNIVFDADAYTTRAPQPFRLAKKDADIAFRDKYREIAKEFDGYIDDTVSQLSFQETKKNASESRFNDVKRFLESNLVADIAFLKERGITDIPTKDLGDGETRVDLMALRDKVEPLQEEKRAWMDSELDKYFKEEELFDASTNRDYVTGRGLKLKPFTADEVLKFMKKSRGSAQEANAFAVGPGLLRASLTNKLKSLQAMRDSRGKLVAEGEFQTFKDDSYEKVFELAEKLKNSYQFDSDSFRYTDQVIEMLVDSERFGLDKSLRDFGFEDVSPEIIEEITNLKQFFREAPTEYFEAKPERIVGLDEFQGAIVPEGTPQATLERLERAGLQIETYSTPEERLAKRKNFKGTVFSPAPAAIGAGLLAASSEPTTRDKAIAAGEVARQAMGGLLATPGAALQTIIQATTGNAPTSQLEANFERMASRPEFQPQTQLGKEYSEAAQKGLLDVMRGPLAAGSAIVEPLSEAASLLPRRARLVGRSLLDLL